MFTNTPNLRKFSPTAAAATVKRRLGVGLQTSVLALACVAAVCGPASARTAYDGDWSVVIMTRNGACEPAVRYGVQIDNGAVINAEGGQAAVQGRVSPGGTIRVNVQSGNAWAEGSGRLKGNFGGGVWRGQGARGNCAGTWTAQRRSDGMQAEAPGAPLYNYAPGAVAMQPPALAGRAVAYCQARFRSYDPATGTYMGFDGLRHPCP